MISTLGSHQKSLPEPPGSGPEAPGGKHAMVITDFKKMYTSQEPPGTSREPPGGSQSLQGAPRESKCNQASEPPSFQVASAECAKRKQ